MRMSTALLTIATILTAAERAPAQDSPSADSTAVTAVVNAFHDALARGDSAAALQLLAPDLRVLESGQIEDLSEYRAHHLAADIAFARAVPAERQIRTVTVVGPVAWLAATSRTRGTYRDRAIDSDGAELMVVARTAEGWRIRAIHWSSRARSRSPASAQPGPLADPTLAVLALSDSILAAAGDQDAERFAGYFSDRPGFRYLINATQLESREALHAAFEAMLRRQQAFRPSWRSRSVQVVTPEIAILTGTFSTQARRLNGEEWAANGAVTFVAVKESDRWRVVHWHTSE